MDLCTRYTHSIRGTHYVARPFRSLVSTHESMGPALGAIQHPFKHWVVGIGDRVCVPLILSSLFSSALNGSKTRHRRGERVETNEACRATHSINSPLGGGWMSQRRRFSLYMSCDHSSSQHFRRADARHVACTNWKMYKRLFEQCFLLPWRSEWSITGSTSPIFPAGSESQQFSTI